MEACVVICRAKKPSEREGEILFIDAAREVVRDRAQSFLATENQVRILHAYNAFTNQTGFAAVASIKGVLANDANLSIANYVLSSSKETLNAVHTSDIRESWANVDNQRVAFWEQLDGVVEMLDQFVNNRESNA